MITAMPLPSFEPDIVVTPSGGDDAAIVQRLANQLAAGSELGGAIGIKGVLSFQSQLVLPPNIGIYGQGPIGYSISGTPHGPGIKCSGFNGSAIVCTGNAAGSTFTSLANFFMIGQNALTSQNGIEWNNSAGNIFDTLVFQVSLFNFGQHGFLVGGTGTKVWLDGCYVETCVKDAINHTNGLVFARGCYLTSNSGNGYNGISGGSIYMAQVIINANTGSAVIISPSSQNAILDGCSFGNNGSSTTPQIVVANMTGGNPGQVNITSCAMFDTRGGGSNVTNHMTIATANAVPLGNIMSNNFAGSQGPAITCTARAANKIVIAKNTGFNDTIGKLTNPFTTAAGNRLGIEGTTAAPVASTTYTVGCTDLYCSFTAGTGVSITINDPAGNAISSGLATFTGLLPVGYQINFGAFTVAPTVVVAVA